MKNPSIVFTGINKAELISRELPEEPGEGEVLVRTRFSTISPGTERANITGNPNVRGIREPDVSFPRQCGYSTSGVVEKVGKGVTSVKPGDTVTAFRTVHALRNIVPEKNVVPFDPAKVSFEEAAILYITTFPMAAVRKTRVEIGEPALVMGCGLLGQIAIKELRAAGAVPVIAADPVESRRKLALSSGADHALDPLAPDFAEEVKRLTRGGAKAVIEVTGVGQGLDGALDATARFGRVALLGCTRSKEFTIDYYRKVHCPGITLIGAHTDARPETESRPGVFTTRDDIASMLALLENRRLSFDSFPRAKYAPGECGEAFTRLINDRDFPLITQFDWDLF